VPITFRVRRRRGEMYSGHWSVVMTICLCVCLFLAAFQHYCTDPGVSWGNGTGCPLVVHYWADLQSLHGLRCYDNSAEREMSASACTRCVPGLDVAWPARAPIVSSVTAQSSRTSVPIITLLHLYA